MEIWQTIEELRAESKTVATSDREKYAAQGIALPDGSFPIPNKDFLRRAIQSIGRAGASKRAAVKAHITKRAKALGATSMLPDGWVTSEEMEITDILPDDFYSFLVLEGNVPKIVLLEQTDEEKASGTLKVKMPFYVGESLARTPHIPKRVYFPTGILAETISEGMKQIKAGKQPLTVYGRHAHALADDHLPMGAIVNLEQEGRIGYATLEIEPTTYGKDAQILLRSGKLNAISLRSGPKRFELEEVQVNGEDVYQAKKLLLDGVDFAPNSPAMETYGVEILAAEASVTPIEKKKEVLPQVDEITLEAVRGKPDIVSEIEKPLLLSLNAEKEKNKALAAEKEAALAEIKTFKEAATRNELATYVAEMASKHPQKDEALKLFMEVAKECTTKEEFSAKILPYFVNAAAAITPVAPIATLEERMKKLFPTSNSISLVEEAEEEDEVKGQRIGPLEVPA